MEGVPPGVTVEVFDYDIENHRDELLSKDASGKACEIKEWHAPGINSLDQANPCPARLRIKEIQHGL